MKHVSSGGAIAVALLDAVAFAAGSGCTNKPGAVTLDVTPVQHDWNANETVRLRAVLRSDSDRVLLSRACGWSVRMREPGGATLRSQRPELPPETSKHKEPWVYLGSVFDVKDSKERFDHLYRGDQRSYLITLTRGPAGELIASASQSSSSADSQAPQQSWTPGDYNISVSLENEARGPAPLFHRPYDRLVAADCRIRITR